MTGDCFAMVSEWMTNGDIKRFVAIHPHENRFELLSSLLKCLTPSIVDDCATPIAGRRSEGLGLYAQSGNDPRRSQRGMSSRPGSLSLPLMDSVREGQYPCRSDRSCSSGGLRPTDNHIKHHQHYILELISARWHSPMDESGALRSGGV